MLIELYYKSLRKKKKVNQSYLASIKVVGS